MQWMNQNSGAVQAIMAILIGALTAVLIAVTWWYAKLTRRMALTLEQQLAASFHPDIEMMLDDRFRGQGIDSSGAKDESVAGTIVITNKGDLPLKVVSVAMKLVYNKKAFPTQTIMKDAQQRVVPPGKTTQFQLVLEVPLGGSRAEYEQSAQIHCSDLAGVSKHSFSVSDRDKGVINQSIGFQPI